LGKAEERLKTPNVKAFQKGTEKQPMGHKRGGVRPFWSARSLASKTKDEWVFVRGFAPRHKKGDQQQPEMEVSNKSL